jgi:hypothetical protein
MFSPNQPARIAKDKNQTAVTLKDPMKIQSITCAGLLALTQGAYAAELHVATTGQDTNPGTAAAPLRSIQRGAELAQAGDTITVHAGVYRERVTPPRGGESDAKRIVYQAAPGEKVEIKGSEIVTGWEKAGNDTWKVTLPNTFFGNFNPFRDLIRGDWFYPKGRVHHTGAVYLNGAWLTEAAAKDEVLKPAGDTALWFTDDVPAPSEYLINVAWLRPGTGDATAGRIAADKFSSQGGGPKAAPCSEGDACVGFIKQNDWLCYQNVDFGQGAESVVIRAAALADGNQVELRLDSASGELLGVCPVARTGDWQKWTSFTAKIKPTSGVKSLCLVFKAAPAETTDPTHTTIWAQFKGVDPNKQLVEINTRQTVFYPAKPFINYLTVRGFTLCQAATPWAPPTAEQIGLIGTHWSKGWIIENNVISHSVCSGIALGKYGDEWDNKAESAEGYVGTINRALKNGWNKETIGHHLVRNNTISHCEQTGIVGSLGCSFSTVTGNTIHDIHVRQLFDGCEQAGIKFHGAIDVEISRNHIYRTIRGIWLDWMAQGARVSANLLHDNNIGGYCQDLFLEVDHGPFLVDNNIFLSPTTVFMPSQGGAFVHNLIGGSIQLQDFDSRLTPFHKAHSTELAGLHDNPSGDVRFYNNLFVNGGNLSAYDAPRLPVWMDGNVFLAGTTPSKLEATPLLKPDFDPAAKLVEKNGGFYLVMKSDKSWSSERTRKLVTTDLLGKAAIPGLPFEAPDGSPYRIDRDYFGKPRNTANPVPGPFENPGTGINELRVR